ncbi:MAG: 50S ribosomal protein L35 [Candidatus Omnitrophota bacterium]|jgi:large subunit ribosomal protein L35
MKLKTHKGIKKRLKVTKSGKIKYSACGKSHLLSKKKSKRKRGLRKSRILKRLGQKRYIKRLLPYS